MATIKQKRAIANVVGNGGNVTQAMIEAGYSIETAHTPQKLTESRAWKDIMEEQLPDDLLAREHKELLSQKRIDYFMFSNSMDDEEIIEHVKAAGVDVITVRKTEKGKMAFYSIPDAQAIKGGLDMAYKLKGSYAAEKTQALNLNINANMEDKSELEAIREKYEAEIRSKYNK